MVTQVGSHDSSNIKKNVVYIFLIDCIPLKYVILTENRILALYTINIAIYIIRGAFKKFPYGASNHFNST